MKKIKKRTAKELEIIKSFLEDYDLGTTPSYYIISTEVMEECLK